MMDQDVDVSDIKATGNDTYKIATYRMLTAVQIITMVIRTPMM